MSFTTLHIEKDPAFAGSFSLPRISFELYEIFCYYRHMSSVQTFFATYAYLFGAIIFFIPWCIVFFKKRVNRKEMLIYGIVFGIAAVLIGIRYALHDYWHPSYLFPAFHLEDFLYGFFFGGLCTQIYFFFFEIKERATKNHHPIFGFIALIISILSFVLITDILKLNSIIAHIIPPLLVGIYIAYKNPRTVKIQILAGFFSMIVTFLVFRTVLLISPHAVTEIWYLNNLTGLLILGIPLEEYVFAFSLGFGISLFHEFILGKQIVLKK
jgi:hypothetical protein